MKAEDPESSVGSATTPTQALRNTLSAFRFDEQTTPSLRRSPRIILRAGVKTEETESELPAVCVGGSRKRSVSSAAVASDSEADAKKTTRKSRRRSKVSKARPAIAPLEKYAHLNSLNDYLGREPDLLDVLFCGINPGQRSATVGHHFAHPTNHFWKCLYGSNFTDHLVDASEDYTLPDTYQLGLTNLVERPSAQVRMVFVVCLATTAEIVRKRPRIVCFVGKAIWESFIKAAAPPSASNEGVVIAETKQATSSSGRTETFTQVQQSAIVGKARAKGKMKAKPPPFGFGLQPFKVVHSDPNAAVRETLFCVVVSTSGLVAGYQLPEKVQQFSSVKRCLDDMKSGDLDTSAMRIIPIPPETVPPQ
ncbi:DNA glycosylase [Trametes sanguinea]|nr:DNA glycosylase [Trametes sanguinea]